VTGQPNQDAVASRRIGSDALVVAVADGHGNKRHFRSVRGSELAVGIGIGVGAELIDGLEAPGSAERIEGQMREYLVPAIVTRWREAVRADLDARPLTGEEEGLRAPGDDELIAYGSTLMLALIWRHWLILAQIGDGDVLGVRPDGSPSRPVPGDPILDGNQTTSLCGPRPEGDFRVRAVDLEQTPLLALLIATDGYGNAQAADPWAEAVSADLAELIGERDPQWFGEQLPVWASRCASADGSGDDTTIALLIAPGAAQAQQRAKLAAVAPTFRYVRSVPAPDAQSATVRADDGAGEGADAVTGEPAPAGAAVRPLLSRRSIVTIAVSAAAAVVLLAVGIPLLLSLGRSGSPSGNPFTHPAGPSATHSRSAGPSSSPSRTTSPSVTPSSQPLHIPMSGITPLPKLPPQTPHKAFAKNVVIILFQKKFFWCTAFTPQPTGCRQIELSGLPSNLHLAQRFTQINRIETCQASGSNPVIELPPISIPGVGRLGGVQVTFPGNPAIPGLETLSLFTSLTPQCPSGG
jgi:hypothetical protein